MASLDSEPYFEPVSQGICDVPDCSNAAKYRAWWAQGMFIRLVCTTHKAEIEGLPKEANPFTIFAVRAARQRP